MGDGAAQKQTRGRRLAQRALVLGLGAIAALVLLEVGLRLAGWGVSLQQERRIQRALREEGAYRILCLGDSMTGYQYPAFLEDALAERFPDEPFAVLDKGRPRLTASAIVATLPEHLDRYSPDMVIVMMGFNDDDRLLAYGGIPPTEHTPLRVYDLARLLIYNHRTRATADASSQGVAAPGPGGGGPGPGVPADCGDGPGRAGGRGSGIQRALCHADRGETDEAIALLEGALEPDSDDARALLELGQLYRQGDRDEEAIALFARAAEAEPWNEGAWLALGESRRDVGDLAGAEEALGRALELDPEHEWALFELGKVLDIQGRDREAEAALRRAAHDNPDGDIAEVALAWWYRDRGRLVDAEEVLQAALQATPRDDRLLSVLSFVRGDQGREDEASELREQVHLLRIASYDPVTRDAYLELRREVLERGITLVCMQYPMRDGEALRRILSPPEGEIYIDSEAVFRDAVQAGRYEDHFIDVFGGDFGHPTDAGNRLLAGHIADTLAAEAFDRHLE